MKINDFVGRFRRLMRALLYVSSGRYPSEKIIRFQSAGSSDSEPHNEIVTLMFIDISGFSVVAESLTPEATYRTIKDPMNEIFDCIIRHGGVIDKNTGDGVFAYFRSVNRTKKNISHADQAIKCGREIQELNMNRIMKSIESDKPILPLRIGINTASVCLGKIGNHLHWEYAVFGRGVNFAQQLEQACDLFSVMVSEATLELSTQYSSATPGFARKILKPKHYVSVIQAYELNPFYDRTLLREKAMEEYRLSRNLQRKQQRVLVPEEQEWEFVSDFGKLHIVDFSVGGISIALDKYLAKNVDFSIKIDPKSSKVAKEIYDRGIDSLHIIVRWGKADNKKFIHGAKFTNLSDSQKEFLFHCLEDQIEGVYLNDAMVS